MPSVTGHGFADTNQRGMNQYGAHQHDSADSEQLGPNQHDANQYTGRRRAGFNSGDQGRRSGYGHRSELGIDESGYRLTGSGSYADTATATHRAAGSNLDGAATYGAERASRRSAGRPRTPGRRRAPVAENTRPHLSGRLAKAGPLALAMAIGGAVAAFAAPNAPAAATPPVVTCALRVPDQPLTAQGLATPYELSGFGGQGCHEANAGTAAFVQGLILDPATGQLSVYDPLVIDRGSEPAVAPVVPTLPANAIVALWFGFNGNVLTLEGNGVQDGACVNGTDGSPFGQFAYCNAPALFTAAHTAITQGKLKIPPIGTAADKQPCPTTRDFGIVDQDQSDNVTTTYLVLADGRTAQNTQAAAKQLRGKAPTVLANGSDNLLVDHFVDPALDCAPFTAPDLANDGFSATALGLNELQAEADQAAPVALVPLNDPMVLNNDGAQNDQKADLYRAGVDQPPLAQVPGSAAQYCANLRTLGVARTKLDRTLTDTTVSPDTGAASNLFTFLAMRLQQSYANLGCQELLGMRNPVHLKLNGAGLVVDASFDRVNVGPSASPSASASAAASPSASAGAGTSASPSASAVGAASPSASPVTVTTAPAPPVQSSTPATTVTTPPAATSSNAAPPPPAATPSSASTTAQGAAAGANHSSPGPVGSASAGGVGGVGGVTGSVGSGQQNGQSGGNSSSDGAAGVGSVGGVVGATTTGGKPVVAVTSTPISVAGFEHTYTAGSANPNSALAGPDPMAKTGFSVMNSRVFWALAGALIVLCASLLYQRRPKQRRQSRRGTS
ncbi:MAG TPA: hypothetical protein VFA06_10575 [Actinocrinis sp.]|uniref:hypothetical protein n=1 Tax=Actinocrinis sp. TaxID=1920516 RepID=UPI002D50126B|nr:hypothetical protein [Actinocrinis sp.]HZU56302.1 hypothetical protein [Actinocrinis sp.]